MVQRSTTLLAIGLCLGLGACFSTHPWVEQPRPWTAETIAGAEKVRIERADGSRTTMVSARITQAADGARIAGWSVPEKGRAEIAYDVALSELSRLETSRLDLGRWIFNGICWTLVVLSALGALSVAAMAGAF